MAKTVIIEPLLPGQRFFRLEILDVIGRDEKSKLWVTVRCDCGSSPKPVLFSSIKNGHTKSCGCWKREEKSSRFEKQRAFRLNEKRNKLQLIGWSAKNALFKCDCGNQISCQYWSFKNGHVKTCGKCHPDGSNGAAKNRVYGSFKASARTRGIAFSLTKIQTEAISQLDCIYCGAAPSCHTSRYPLYFYGSIDRVCSNLATGYAPNNVVPSCKSCNLAKGRMTLEEFMLRKASRGDFTTADVLTKCKYIRQFCRDFANV